MNAIALATRKLSDPLLLVGAREIKTRDVCAGVYLALSEVKNIGAVGYFFPDSLVRAQRIARLIDVAELDCGPDTKGASVGLVLLRNEPKKGRFARPVRADHAHDSARWKREIEIFEK